MTERFDLYSINIYMKTYCCFLLHKACLDVKAGFNIQVYKSQIFTCIIGLSQFDRQSLPQIIDDSRY
jgi:hypothetical protein